MAVSLFSVFAIDLFCVVQSFKFESQKIIPFTTTKRTEYCSCSCSCIKVVSIVASKEKRCQKQK